MSLSGFGLCGSDIGGFYLDPDGELYTRWVQLAVFHPVMRTHSMGNNADGATQTDREAVEAAQARDRQDQEPWSYGDPWTGYVKSAIEWRYRLLPVVYTAIEALHRVGTPPLVPIHMDDPSDERLVDRHAFRFGEHLFVDPVVRSGQLNKQVRFPKGRWYHLETGECVDGGQSRFVATPHDQLACWVRGGAVIQLDPVRQSTGLPFTSSPELHVFHAEGRRRSSLYQDAGEGYGHEAGEFLRKRFQYEGTDSQASVSVTWEGEYELPYATNTLVWHGLPAGTWQLSVDGADLDWSPSGNTWRAEIPVGAGVLLVRLV